MKGELHKNLTNITNLDIASSYLYYFDINLQMRMLPPVKTSFDLIRA